MITYIRSIFVLCGIFSAHAAETPAAPKKSPPKAETTIIAKNSKAEIRHWFCEFASVTKTEWKSYLPKGGMPTEVKHVKLQQRTPGDHLALGFEFSSSVSKGMSYAAGVSSVRLTSGDKPGSAPVAVMPVYNQVPADVTDAAEGSWMRLGAMIIQPLGSVFASDDMEFWSVGGTDPINCCMPLRPASKTGRLTHRFIYLFKLTPEQSAALSENANAFTISGISDSTLLKDLPKLVKGPTSVNLRDLPATDAPAKPAEHQTRKP